jgi:hypothetical protein
VLIAHSARAGGPRSFVRALLPAALTGTALALALAALFGPEALLNTLLPTTGAESYRQMNYGFFRGVGRSFWLPERPSLRYYVASQAGHYLVGSVVLLAAGAAAWWRLARRRSGWADLGTEVIACTAMMHLAFLTMFYAAWTSWTYYYDVLLVGLAAASARGRRASVLVAFLAVAALVGHKHWFNNCVAAWKSQAPSASTAGLWADAGERDEWRRVRQAVAGQTASLLTTQGGCLELLVPGFSDPEDFFLAPGIPRDVELRCKLDQVATARTVIIRRFATDRSFLELWPQFRRSLDGCDLTWDGPRYQVYTRRSPPS